MNEPEHVEKLKQFFSEQPQVRLAFLFGSGAADRLSSESDFDIAVCLRDPAQEDRLWRELTRLLDTEVDLIPLDRAPATLASAVLKQGIPLVIRDPALHHRLLVTRTTEAEEFAEFVAEYAAIARRSASLAPEDRTRLLERIRFLESELNELDSFRAVTKEAYLTDKTRRRNLERWAENILNAAIDIAKTVLAAEQQPVPKTYQAALESFALLAGVDAEGAARFSALARLRNLLAHEYLEILHEQINRLIEELPPLYATIGAFLDTYLAPEKKDIEGPTG